MKVNIKKIDNADRYKDLGYAISYYRKRKHLTQENVAEMVGISRQHLSAIEAPNMNRALSLDVVFKIADSLDVEPYILLKFNHDK